MLPVNLTAYTSHYGTDIVHNIQEIILRNGCYVTDFINFGPTEMSIQFEGDNISVQKVLIKIRELNVTFTDYSEYEISFLNNRKGDLTVILYLYTGRKKDIGNILDERFKK